jgi:hypothetical protein
VSADKIPVGYLTLDEAVILLAEDLSDREAPLAELTSLEADLAGGPKESREPYIKREIAVKKIYSALTRNELDAFVCEAANVFRVTAADWRGPIHWRESIIGGVVRASLDAAISRHSGQRLLVSVDAFKNWLKDRPRRRLRAPKDCRLWLVAEMRESPGQSPRPKPWYLDEAQKRFGISEREFERAWDHAKQESGAEWGRAGRRPIKLPQ